MNIRAVRCLLFVLCLYCHSAIAGPTQTLVVEGTGDSQVIMRSLAEAFERLHTEINVFVPDSTGSGGGIRLLKKGQADLARTARPLKEKERPGLVEYLFARTPVVFATHRSVPLSDLSQDQILGIYSGKWRRWREVGGSDDKIYVVTREPGDSSRTVIENKLPEFARYGAVAKVFYSTPEAKTAIAEHPSTIGYIPLPEALSESLNILSIDGIEANEDNTLSQTYPFYTPLYVISEESPTKFAFAFIDFLYSEGARSIMRSMGVFPAEKPAALK